MRGVALALVLAVGASGFGPAVADHAPTIVVPGRPGVPVVINGRDASWAVVEGDWGLYRAGHMAPTVFHGMPIFMGPPHGAYYPFTGRVPARGRYEVDTPQSRRQRPAQPYYRSWTSESPDIPATVYPPYEPPQVTIEPRRRRRY